MTQFFSSVQYTHLYNKQCRNIRRLSMIHEVTNTDNTIKVWHGISVDRM